MSTKTYCSRMSFRQWCAHLLIIQRHFKSLSRFRGRSGGCPKQEKIKVNTFSRSARALAAAWQLSIIGSRNAELRRGCSGLAGNSHVELRLWRSTLTIQFRSYITAMRRFMLVSWPKFSPMQPFRFDSEVAARRRSDSASTGACSASLSGLFGALRFRTVRL